MTSGTRLRTAERCGEHLPVATDLILLDCFTLRYDGMSVATGLGGQRLLALLALRGRLPRTALAGTLWPNSTDARALASLRTALWQLGRRRPSPVETDHDHLSLRPAVVVDVHVVTGWASRIADGAAPDDDLDLSFAGGGELLPGWYEDWVQFERERLRQMRLHALENVAVQLGQRRRYAAAIQTALEAIRLDPLRESAHRTLIGVHLSEGNVVEAVRNFDAFRCMLRAELGVEPSPRLRALVTGMPVVNVSPVQS